MHEESIAIIILWALIFVYSILGSIDLELVLGHGIRQTSNSRCQTCESVLITHLGSNKYVSCFRRCRIFGFFPKAAFTLATVMFVPVMLILVLVAVRSTFMVFAYLTKISVPSSGYFRYYWSLNSSTINYRFTRYRGSLYYNV